MSENKKQYTEVEFNLTEDTVVTNDTVKISVTIAVMINGDITNENLSGAVRSTLKKFIDGDWAFSNPTRQFDTGIEKAIYQAHIRVPAEQNYDLNARANEVNSKGIQISNIQPDVSIPVYQMREAESKLRAKLVKSAKAEADILSEVYGIRLTIKSIAFGKMDDYSTAKSLRAGTYAASATSFMDEQPAIGNSERVSMMAQIKLCAPNNELREIDG